MVAARLTAEALKDGAEQIIAVGGDGTINEVVNGFFEDGRLINSEAVLGLLPSGTGGDFRRTFGIPPDVDGQIARLASGAPRPIDLGRLSFKDDEGKDCVRYFDNIASFGLSGLADRAVNGLTVGKKFGGKLAFKWGTFKAMMKYRNQPVRIQVDDTFDHVANVSTAAVCNGQYFGGSMRMAPDAVPDDGLFDVVIWADAGALQLLLRSNEIYRGMHVNREDVTVLRGRRVIATPAEGAGEVLLDVDGEAPGRLPATFEILPKVIRLRC